MCVHLCVCVSGFDVAESTSIVIYITQLCCMFYVCPSVCVCVCQWI